MDRARLNFLQRYLDGECPFEAIDDAISEWHRGGTEVELWEFLGMTREQYETWANDEDALIAQLADRRRPVPSAS